MKSTSTFEKGGAKSYPLLGKVEPNNPLLGKVEQNLIHISLCSEKVQRDFREA